ncbi:hypothetical protein CDD82_3450 [Ophiocordyceps australis]|uniref:Lysophospholipid acyltransferase n=1 Tax=Ophiocordyceps australis TaxID=1399860 RepID=A0A2C5YHP4_9HYPO|nr:hypothetical protein CDD82_3450 [Ophiocordyceps australis]
MLHSLHRAFEALSPTIGASPDELKIIFSLLLSYPLAAVLKRVPDARPARKNAFIILISVFYLVGLFDLWHGLVTLVFSAAGSYCIANHIKRQMADSPAIVDVTGAQMVLVMKLSAFCWNVADGQLPREHLSDLQRDRALGDVPPLLDFAGYVFFFPSLLAGPAFDYAEYSRWIDTSMFDVPTGMDPAKRPPVRKRRRIPRSGSPATARAALGLVWIALYAYLGPRFSPDHLVSDSFLRHKFPARIMVMYLVNLVARFKYYGVWTLAEGSCILAGLGYNGVDAISGTVYWNRLQNVDPWAVETAQNPRGYLAGWNKNTNNWLRNYVYLRVTPRGKKPGFRASLTTFATSALWHGFYPGYYLSFVLASLIQTAAKNYRRLLRPLFIDPVSGEPTAHKKYYDVLSFVVTQLTFSFTTTPFLVLGLSCSLRAWSRVYFYALTWTVASLVLFASPAKPMLKARLEQRQGKARAGMTRSVSTDSLMAKEPILGISTDAQRDLNEAVREIKAEVEARQKKNS